MGIRIQGGTSPASPQKAFDVIARSEYGKNRIEYPIFKNNIEQFYSGNNITPRDYNLHQNYPNPFNPETTIPFNLSHLTRVSILIYDIQGKLVRTLLKGKALGSGSHTISWDGTDNSGNRVGSGTYLFRMTTGGYHKTKKMIFLE